MTAQVSDDSCTVYYRSKKKKKRERDYGTRMTLPFFSPSHDEGTCIHIVKFVDSV